MDAEAQANTAAVLVPPFRSCIEYFERINVGDSATDDLELHTKLYIQRERFLTWGQLCGIPKTLKSNHPQKLEAKKASILTCLTKLQRLISDPSDLEEKYGLLQEESEASTEEHSCHLGSERARKLKKSMAPSPEDQKEWIQITTERKMWYINDQDKFGQLIVDVAALVDDLHNQIPIDPPEQQDTFVFKDLKLLDAVDLEFVSNACKGTHQAWSDKADSLVTTSRDKSKETETKPSSKAQVDIWGLEGESWGFGGSASQKSTVQNVYLNISGIKGTAHFFFLFTQPCFASGEDLSCGPTKFGQETFGSKIFEFGKGLFFSTEDQKESRWSPCRRIIDSLKLKFPHIKDLINEGSSEEYEAQNALLKFKFPFACIYIYCGPCVCALRTALAMCDYADSFTVRCVVRVDDRIDTHCCPQGKKLGRLRSLIGRIKESESGNGCNSISTEKDFVDRIWLEKRIYALETRTIGKNRVEGGKEIFAELEVEYGDATTDAFVILGELSTCQWMMQSSPFPKLARSPRETEMYHFKVIDVGYSKTWKHEYLGTFTPRKYSTKWGH